MRVRRCLSFSISTSRLLSLGVKADCSTRRVSAFRKSPSFVTSSALAAAARFRGHVLADLHAERAANPRDLSAAVPETQHSKDPAVDFASHRGLPAPSYQRDFRGFPLSIEAIEYFIGHYLRDRSDYTDPRAAPLLATNFKQLAPAFVLTAGYDPLADEGMAYARKLEENGVPVTLVHMSDQMHGFLTMGRVIRASDFALEIAGMALARAFNSKQPVASTQELKGVAFG